MLLLNTELKKVAHYEATLGLLDALKDEPSDERRLHYRMLLRSLRNELAIPALGDLVSTDQPNDFEEDAAAALAGIGTPEAVIALMKGVERREISDVEHPFLVALRSVQNKDALFIMAHTFERSEHESVRHAAATVLSSAGMDAVDAALKYMEYDESTTY